MHSFFYYDGTNQLGPFSIEELKNKNISKDTLVWYEGLSDWKKAGDIELLESIFKLAPPPLPKASIPPPVNNATKEAQKKSGKTKLRKPIVIALSIVFIAAISLLIVRFSKTSVSQVKNIEGLSEVVKQLEYSPDGKTIVSGSGDYLFIDDEQPCMVNIWDVNKGEIIKRLNQDNSVKGVINSLSFNKAGTKILIASSNCIKIESTNIGDLTSYTIKAAEGDFFIDAVFSNKEDQVIYIPDYGNKIIFCDAKSGIKYDSLITNFEQIDKLNISPDGSKLILLGHNRGSDNGYFITIYDLVSKTEMKNLKIEYNRLLEFNKTGNRFAFAKNDGIIEIRDAETLQVLNTFSGHYKTPSEVSFSYDDKYLASCSSDQMIKIFDITSGKEVKTLINEHKGSIYTISFNPLSNTFATAGDDKTIKIWEIR